MPLRRHIVYTASFARFDAIYEKLFANGTLGLGDKFLTIPPGQSACRFPRFLVMLLRDAFTLLGIPEQVLHLPRVVSFRQLRPFGFARVGILRTCGVHELVVACSRGGSPCEHSATLADF